LLLNLVCTKYHFTPGFVKINIGNAHIYAEHTKPVLEYLNNQIHDLPTLANYQDEVINFDTSKVSIKHYVSEGFIKAKIII
jgi:thymidylate synthase